MDENTAPEAHDRRWDVVIVGGGVAGLAAAVQLGRSRRSVVVVDAGEPRNAPAAHLHGYLGHDGLPPSELLALGRDEARRYGVELRAGAAAEVSRADDTDAFAVHLDDGATLHGRRVLLATGLTDELPELPGIAEQWGRGVIHCPYCHGWEVRDQPIVVLATGAMAAHQALLFRQLSERVTVVLHETEIDAADRRLFLARGIRLRGGPVAEVVVEDGEVSGVRLVDGTLVDATTVVVAPRMVARTAAVERLGVTVEPLPMSEGQTIVTDETGQTDVAGLYAAGNVHDAGQQLLQAAAEGSRVAARINADLVHDDATRAADNVLDDTAAAWDQRYTGADRTWSGNPNGTLVAEVEGVEPGTALDLGCGEGADAIWLAQRGWKVTALDISAVAIERAREAAADAGVEVDWVVADLTAEPPTAGAYDLVSAQYLAVPEDADDAVARSIVEAVAPGGVLLAVHHDVETMRAHSHDHGWDPADYVLPADLAAVLDGGWKVEADEVRRRIRPAGSPGPDVPDVVVRARRTEALSS